MNTTMKYEGRSTLVEPIFGPGMLLQHEDLELQTTYTKELNRLMFRSLFGCGVVCGLKVKFDEKQRQVIVEAGVAIDGNGDPIEVPRDHSLAASKDCMEIEEELWVVLCGTVKYCVPRSTTCSSDDEPASQATRAIHAYEIKLVTELHKCVCSCTKEVQQGVIETDKDCYKSHINGECDCTCDGCSGAKCKCVLLARIHAKVAGKEREIDHGVRRFVRPALLPEIKANSLNLVPKKPVAPQRSENDTREQEKAPSRDTDVEGKADAKVEANVDAKADAAVKANIKLEADAKQLADETSNNDVAESSELDADEEPAREIREERDELKTLVRRLVLDSVVQASSDVSAGLTEWKKRGGDDATFNQIIEKEKDLLKSKWSEFETQTNGAKSELANAWKDSLQDKGIKVTKKLGEKLIEAIIEQEAASG